MIRRISSVLGREEGCQAGRMKIIGGLRHGISVHASLVMMGRSGGVGAKCGEAIVLLVLGWEMCC